MSRPQEASFRVGRLFVVDSVSNLVPQDRHTENDEAETGLLAYGCPGTTARRCIAVLRPFDRSEEAAVTVGDGIPAR
jgi:hypothetical protein